MKIELLAIPLGVALLPVMAYMLGKLKPGLYLTLCLRPRRPQAIWSIATFPFHHVNRRHLIFNTVPLAILGALIAVKSLQLYLLVNLVVLLICGWGTWLFSTGQRVAGASGMVFGYWGFIICSGFLNQDTFWGAAALLTLMIYASVWNSLMRLQEGVSWSCHFWGLMGGIAATLLTI